MLSPTPHLQASGSDKHIRIEFAKSNSKPPKHARVWYSAAASTPAESFTTVGMKRPALESSAYAQYASPYAAYAQQYPGYAQQHATAQTYAQPDWHAYQSAAGYAGSSAGFYGQQQQQQQQHSMYSAALSSDTQQRASNNPP
jgi:hypothetical protein